MKIIGKILKYREGTHLRQLDQTGACHAVIGQNRNDYYNVIQIVYLENNLIKKYYHELIKIISKFEELGFYIKIIDNIKAPNGLNYQVIETDINKNRKSKYAKYQLFMYEIFRSLITHELLLLNTIEFMKKYDKMDIWDVYYLAHQETRAKKIIMPKWDTYYDPIPWQFIEYVPIGKIQEYFNKTAFNHLISSNPIQFLWKVIPRRKYNIELIQNKPLSEQIKISEYEKVIIKIKSIYDIHKDPLYIGSTIQYNGLTGFVICVQKLNNKQYLWYKHSKNKISKHFVNNEISKFKI